MNDLLKLVLDNPGYTESYKVLDDATHIRIETDADGNPILSLEIVKSTRVSRRSELITLDANELRLSVVSPDVELIETDLPDKDDPILMEAVKIRDFVNKGFPSYTVYGGDLKDELVEYKYARLINGLLAKYVLIKDKLDETGSDTPVVKQILRVMTATIKAVNHLMYHLRSEYRNLRPIRHNAGYITSFYKKTDDGFTLGNLIAKKNSAKERYNITLDIAGTLFEHKVVKSDLFDLLHAITGGEEEYSRDFKNKFKAFAPSTQMRDGGDSDSGYHVVTMHYAESDARLYIKDRLIDNISDSCKEVAFNPKSFLNSVTTPILNKLQAGGDSNICFDAEDLNYLDVSDFNDIIEDDNIRTPYFHAVTILGYLRKDETPSNNWLRVLLRGYLCRLSAYAVTVFKEQKDGDLQRDSNGNAITSVPSPFSLL